MRYGTGYLNTDYEVENQDEPLPNAPYALTLAFGHATRTTFNLLTS
ncbi:MULTISPECIES: hypothetical protein [Moorena]|nr:hypothetical protein [Moorena bouillonii]